MSPSARVRCVGAGPAATLHHSVRPLRRPTVSERHVELNIARLDGTPPDFAARPLPSERVIALHCSGSGGRQWRALAEAIGPDMELLAPEQYGTASAGHWPGHKAFSLAEEARYIIGLLDAAACPVHLIGHSYGGGVALHAALARPHAVASLSLYEPSAFYLLKAAGDGAARELAEIEGVVAAVRHGMATGDYDAAMRSFIDYWCGSGAWQGMKPDLKAALLRWSPKALLDFHALLEEPVPDDDFAQLKMPVLLMVGEQAPGSTRKVAELLSVRLPAVRTVTIRSAGHMGPVTHREAVNEAIVRHIRITSSPLPVSLRPAVR